MTPPGLRGAVVREWDGFSEPQGLAVKRTPAGEARVFVADRAGHAVWRLGPEAATRERVAGTGSIRDGRMPERGRAVETALRSPWGLLLDGRRLLVSMAGSHQLFGVGLESGEIELVAGTGAEAIGDGPSREATLAQPTGLCRSGDDVYLADCESSAVRKMSGDGSIRTVVGTGLFDFGDRDGVGDDARLQHCQDAAFSDGSLAVADTYNDKLKRVGPLSRACGPWPGEAGESGALREPGGVSAVESSRALGLSPASGGLWIADTGNHRIMRTAQNGSLTHVEIEEA